MIHSFRYPSLQLSFPRLFSRLADSGWTHTYSQFPVLDGMDLQLGDVIYFDLPTAGDSAISTFRMIGNFHSEIITSSEVCRYSVPSVPEYRLVNDGVECVSASLYPKDSA